MSDRRLRDSVASQLRSSRAHAGLRAAVSAVPVALAGRRPSGFAHTPWEVLEHLRLAAEDLVAYCLDPGYEARDWPAGYWPAPEAPAPTADDWRESADRLLAATERMAALVEDESVDLWAPVPAAEEADHHTLRAALILLDHNGYHTAELIALRRALGAWPGG